MTDLAGRARAWLDRTYGGRVVLDGLEPLRSTERAELFGCRYAKAREPMLAATICVPRDGRDPFPVANAEPLDENVNLDFAPGDSEPWRWRVNARNCVVAMDAALDGRPASAGPWQSADEEPGWWDRMLSQHFPAAEVAVCDSWWQVLEAVVEGGAGTRGVVWLRRRLDGRALTGHLLYARYDEESGQAVVFDPQLGELVTADDDEVEELMLARFHGPLAAEPPWAAGAADFPAAVAKARGWLDAVYGGQVALVEPTADDETRRGWLFPCTTTRFRETGDWRHQMLDAALLVPKAPGEAPFRPPNRDPWTWLEQWDRGVPGLPAPPETDPGPPEWYGSLTELFDDLSEDRPYAHWAAALDAVGELPVDSFALLWLRRNDIQGRETVGHLLWAVNRGEVVEVFDPTVKGQAPPADVDAFEVRVFPAHTPRGGTRKAS